MSDSRWSSQPWGVAKRAVVGPLRLADGAGQVGPLVRPQHLQHEPAVGGPEAVEDSGPWCPHRHAHGPEVRHDVEHGHQGVEHGDVDALAPAGAVTLAQGGLGADDGEERGHDVAEAAHGRADRRLPLGPLELVGAAHRLDDGGQRGPAGVGGVRGARRHRMAEARDGEVDDGGVRGRHVLVAQTEALNGTGAEVLGDDVEA